MSSSPESLSPVVRGLHHVAIAVPSIADVRAAYENALGLAGGAIEPVPAQGVRVLVLRAGEQRIELVEPAGPDSPVTRFLERRGGGLHHVAWRVDDLPQAIARLLAAGIRMIDREPRAGSHGTRVAFVHPAATGGVLMELVEDRGPLE